MSCSVLRTHKRIFFVLRTFALVVIAISIGRVANAACASPAGNLGALDFQTDRFKFCDGTNWIDLLSASSFPLRAPNGSAGSPTYSFANSNNTGVYLPSAGNLAFATSGTEKMVIDTNGNIRVGTSGSPRAKLDISGAVAGAAAVNNVTATIDFSAGNLQYTTDNCGTFDLHNMKDGASYSFIVQGGTSATCAFNAFSGAGTGALTMHLPPDHGATTSAKHTFYTFVVVGTHVYAAWVTGY